jgi:hypothetical protein
VHWLYNTTQDYEHKHPRLQQDSNPLGRHAPQEPTTYLTTL